ncbi:MAG: DUF4230 domain-containing protein [Bacteroidales bacterium]|nr:DUF4230 domain-containing protein [Bacteroidales bacterium]
MMKRLLYAAVIAIVAGACTKAPDSGAIFYTELRSVDKLVLASMTITKMATIDDIRLSEAKGIKQTADALLSKLKIGDRVAAYSYDTYLRAYIDMSELRPDDIRVDEATKCVTINLPAVRTEFAGREPGMREDHYRVTGLRSAVDARERADLKERMNTHLKQEVEEKDTFSAALMDRAKDKARRYFESLLAPAGYSAVVTFKNA